MASPDFRPYVDLTLFDKQPRDIYEEAVEYAQTVLPELTVRAGTLEDALLQAMSFVGGELIASVNRLPNGLMEGILNLMGFPRLEATYATGSVTFTLVDSNGATIPAGTQVGYTETVEGVSTFHTFRTIAEVTVSSGNTTSSAVGIVADEAGVKPPLLSAQAMVVVSASNRILSAALASDLVSGATSETDVEYFARGVAYLGSLSSSLTTATQLQNYILATYSDVDRCKVYDLTKLTTVAGLSDLTRATNSVTATVSSGHGVLANDIVRVDGAVPTSFNGTFVVSSVGATTIVWSDAGSNESTSTDGTLYHFDSLATSAADDPGEVTVFMGDSAGAAIPAATVSTITSDISSRTVAGLNIYTAAPILVNITVNVEIRTLTGFSTLSVADSVDAYITDLLSPASWDWSSRIRRNQIIARITNLSGVDYVADLTFTVDSGYGDYASVDGSTGDLLMTYKGALPVTSVTVSEAT